MGSVARQEVSCEVLVARFQAGDRAALATLVGRHKRPLYNFILRLVGSPSAAEDLVQDVFGEVVRGATDFEPGSRFSIWAYTIARDLCAAHLRKAAPGHQASVDPPRGEPDGRIVRGVQALSEDQREVFLLREVANLPFKDIAIVTGVPEGTVKSRMRQALERLQESFAEDGDHVRAQG